MSTEILIVLLSLAALVILIALEAPIGLALAGAGLLCIVLLDGFTAASSTLGTGPYTSTAKYVLVVIPMYVLMGTLVANAGLGRRIFRAVNKVVGRLPGGLAATSVFATAIFSGISGSSAADVAAFGRISVTEMTRHGYPKPYSAAVVAAAGAFAALIPPSVTMIIYAILAEQSIGRMLLAGVIPGAMSAAILATFVIMQGYRRRAAERRSAEGQTVVTAGVSVDAVGSSVTAPASKRTRGLDYGERLTNNSLAGRSTTTADALAVFYAAVLFVIVLGGLYAGIFTATEAGAVGAFAALIIAALSFRAEKVSFIKMITSAAKEAVSTTSMIFLLLLGGGILAYGLALSRIPSDLAAVVGELPIPPLLIVALILLLLLPLGAFLDGLSVLLLVVPVVAPLVISLGFDGIWFGILVLKMVEIGLITPPVGVNAFIISGITKVPTEKVFRALVPFVVLDLCATALFFLVPELVMWLPNQIVGG